MNSYARLGVCAILSIIALRVGVGWHFYMEGASKVRENNFTSVGFLNAAKGPLAEKFQSMIWDHDGAIRLDAIKVNAYFESAAKAATKHFSFTDDQTKQVDKLQSAFKTRLAEVYAEAAEDIEKYTKSQDRLLAMGNSPAYKISSLHGQKEKVANELLSAVRPTMGSVEAIWDQYELKLNSIANATQLKSVGKYHFAKPGQGVLSIETVDKIIPIFDMCVGILLIIGLLTPLASLVAAAFLVSIILTQMPGYPGTTPTYNQAVECLALLVLAATDAGRYAGLDFIPWAWWNRPKQPLPLDLKAQPLKT